MGKRALGVSVVCVMLAAGCASDKTKPKDVPACRDIATISQQLNSISDDLAASKKLFADIKASADALVRDAPSSLKTLAGQFETSINTAKPFVDHAKTLDELHQLEQSSTAMQGALNDLATYGTRVGDWKSANCKG